MAVQIARPTDTSIAPGPGVVYQAHARDEDGNTVPDPRLPTFVRDMDPAAREHWVDGQNEANRVIRRCRECKRPLRAAEIEPHALKHASSGEVRAAAGMVLALTERDQILEVLKIVKELADGR